MLAEFGAVGIELFQYDPWVGHHFLCQEVVKTFVPGGEGGSEGRPKVELS